MLRFIIVLFAFFIGFRLLLHFLVKLVNYVSCYNNPAAKFSSYNDHKINPNTKWNTTPKIKTGCNANCTRRLVPIKWDISLKRDSLNTERRFTDTCIIKKNIKKKAESAMATFLPIEDLKNPLIFLKLFIYTQKYTSRTLLTKTKTLKYLFRMILKKFKIVNKNGTFKCHFFKYSTYIYYSKIIFLVTKRAESYSLSALIKREVICVFWLFCQ